MEAPGRLTAGLAGIGAFFLTWAILRAITVELWLLGIVVTDGPPPRIDPLLLATGFAGSFVAARLGGLPAVGILGLYALGLISLTVARFVIEPVLQCALVPRLGCTTSAFDWLVEVSTDLGPK